MTPTILAKIKDYKFEFENDYNTKLFRSQLHILNGQDINIVIDKRRKSRSNNANKYYWGVVIATICREVGYKDNEVNQVHEELKERFLSSYITTRLGKKSRRKITKSTSDLNTSQFENYMSSVRAWASSELNIFIPEPNQYE